MALPTLAEVKNYLPVETSAEDSVITDLLASAKAWAEALIGRPITAASRTMSGLTAYRDPYGRHVLYLPVWPAASSGLVVKDADDATVDTGDYALDVDGGSLIAIDGAWFSNPPYSVTAVSGYSAGSSYAMVDEPMIRKLIFGLVAIAYNQRNPNASSDSGGGGVSVSYQMQNELPPHLNSLVMRLRVPRIR